MKKEDKKYYEKIVSFFDQDLRWWEDVYREDLPKGFFSFEMRKRLNLVTDLLTAEILKMNNPDVLDCGCGTGDILALLAPLRCKLTGFDLNPRYLEMTAEKVPDATLVEGNVEQLPFPDASFDIVYAVGVFQYLEDDQKAAKEIARVTRDGGLVLVTIPNYRMLHLLFDPYYIFRFFGRMIGGDTQPSSDKFDDSKMRRYTLAQQRNLFHKYNLIEIRSMSSSYGPLRFWRKELLPVTTSIRLSELIRNWSELKLCAGLKHVGNHLIISMRKGRISESEVAL